MKLQIRLRARSIHGHSLSAARDSPRDDAASPSSRNHTRWPPASSASTEKTKIRARPGATCLQLARRRSCTSIVKFRERLRKEFALRRSRPPAAELISSMCATRGRVKTASTTHMIIPPIKSAQAITQRFSRFLPICFVKAHAGTAVTTKAISVRLNGCVKIVRSPRSPLRKCAKKLQDAFAKIDR